MAPDCPSVSRRTTRRRMLAHSGAWCTLHPPVAAARKLANLQQYDLLASLKREATRSLRLSQPLERLPPPGYPYQSLVFSSFQ